MVLLSVSCNETSNNKDENNETYSDKRDGKTYKIVKIGKQVWMAENLAYKASSGCWAYDNDTNNVSKYGYLYNFETAQNVCPEGYHLPTKAEFETLLKNYGGSKDSKANYTALMPDGASGFSALLGGLNRSGNPNYPNGAFKEKGGFGYFWSTSPYKRFWNFHTYANNNAWILFVNNYGKGAKISYTHQPWSASVRCVKNK